MNKLSRRAWLGAVGAVAAGGLLVAPGESRATATKPANPAREAIRRRNLPNVTLVTHEGERVRFYDDLVKDKFVAINMMYTGCKTSCPLTIANLVEVHKLLGERVGRDFFMYSITLDPQVDSAAVLNDYAKTFGVGKGWKFLTGTPADIEHLRRRLGFSWANKEMDRDKDFHTGMLRYGNEPLMLWGAVPGMADPAWVAECILFADAPKTGPNGERIVTARAPRARAAPKAAQGEAGASPHHHH